VSLKPEEPGYGFEDALAAPIGYTPSPETLALLESKKDAIRHLADNPAPSLVYFHYDGDSEYDKGFRYGWESAMAAMGSKALTEDGG
jgi:hypothetical protein